MGRILMKNDIKDLKYIIIIFGFSIVYSYIFNCRFELSDMLYILLNFTFSIYVCGTIITYKFNLKYIDSLYKNLTLTFVAVGIVTFAYLYVIKLDFGNYLFWGKALSSSIIFPFYESICFTLAVKKYKININYDKAFIITIIISLLVSYVGLRSSLSFILRMDHERNYILSNIIRIASIALKLYVVKMLYDLKNEISKNLYKYLNIYLLARNITQVTAFNTVQSFRTPIVVLNCLLLVIGQYCVLKIMVSEIAKNPYMNIYSDLIKKTESLENTRNQLSQVSEEKEVLSINYEKKKHDEQLKNELLTNISHEFKTPVNVIYSAVQMQDIIKTNGTTDEMAKYNMIIKQNCNRLIRLINNFIDTTRFDKGNIHADFKCVNIVNTTERIVMSVIPFANSKGLNIIFDTSDEELYSSIDEQLFDRLILNLLSNAIKYSKDTGNIYVNMNASDDEVDIIIKDEGVGISKENLKVIFNRFERIDKSFSRNTEGSGLGLHIVKEIIDLIDGKIEISSEEDKGTSVTVTIPLIKDAVADECSYDQNFDINHEHEVEIEMSDIYL